MAQLQLVAEVRPAGKGFAHQTRREDYVPGVIYGKQVAPMALKVPARELQRVLAHGGRGRLIDLVISRDGSADTRTVMIKEVQADRIKGDLLHVDFHQVSLKDKIHTMVRIVIHGEEAIEKAGGILEHQTRAVEVECLPTEIPEALTVDVSNLHVGGHLSVGDLVAPAGVKIITDPDDVIVTIQAPRSQEETSVEPAPAGEPERVGKKEKEEE